MTSTEPVPAETVSDNKLRRLITKTIFSSYYLYDGDTIPYRDMFNADFNGLITEETAKEHFGECLDFLNDAEKQHFIPTVVQGAPKVFAIAVLARLGGRSIYRLINEFKVTDCMLPIKETDNIPLKTFLEETDGCDFYALQLQFES